MGSDRPDPPIFSIDVTAGDDVSTTVSVAGEVDLATADELARAVLSGLATGPVVVALREVTYMDTSGVQALNTALRAAAEQGQELRLTGGMRPNVLQVLEMTGMLALLPVEGGR